MHDTTSKQNLLPWVLFALVVIIPGLFWLDRHAWSLNHVSVMAIFPLLGIWAWSIMWTHYILGGLRLINGKEKNKTYAVFSGYLVLLLIILHPALLAWQQWQVNALLPPLSFYSYVTSSMKVFILLGSISLLLFISYDIFFRLKTRPIIERNWKWISLSQVLAMFFIFIHALAIGNLSNNAMYEYYWVFLGAIMIPGAGLVIQTDWKTKSPS